MSKLPKDGYPASSKAFDMPAIMKDYDAEQDKKKPSTKQKTKGRFAAALSKFSTSKAR